MIEMWEVAVRDFALKAHGDQRYGDGSHPYSKHLEAVVAVAKEYDLPEEVIKAAWLHDVLEDTSLVPIKLRNKFGADVARLVWAVTDDFPDLPRRVRCPKTWEKIRMIRGVDAAVVLKLCDRIANMEACEWSGKPDMAKMYKKEYSAFREALYGRPSWQAKKLWDRLDKLMERVGWINEWSEYDKT